MFDSQEREKKKKKSKTTTNKKIPLNQVIMFTYHPQAACKGFTIKSIFSKLNLFSQVYSYTEKGVKKYKLEEMQDQVRPWKNRRLYLLGLIDRRLPNSFTCISRWKWRLKIYKCVQSNIM